MFNKMNASDYPTVGQGRPAEVAYFVHISNLSYCVTGTSPQEAMFEALRIHLVAGRSLIEFSRPDDRRVVADLRITCLRVNI